MIGDDHACARRTACGCGKPVLVERRDGEVHRMGRTPDPSAPERTPHARRPFARGLVATTNAALPPKTAVCYDSGLFAVPHPLSLPSLPPISPLTRAT